MAIWEDPDFDMCGLANSHDHLVFTSGMSIDELEAEFNVDAPKHGRNGKRSSPQGYPSGRR